MPAPPPAPCGEGVQGARRMPWRREPKKGAASRDSPRGAARWRRSGGARMGEPRERGLPTRLGNTYLGGGQPGELKHLSTPRKGNQAETPRVAASERGPAQTGGALRACARRAAGVEDASPAPRTVRPGSQTCWGAEDAWEGARHRVRAPYAHPAGPGTRSRVPPGTRNPAGSRGDRPPRLSTPLRPTADQYREGKVKSTPGGE